MSSIVRYELWKSKRRWCGAPVGLAFVATVASGKVYRSNKPHGYVGMGDGELGGVYDPSAQRVGTAQEAAQVRADLGGGGGEGGGSGLR